MARESKYDKPQVAFVKAKLKKTLRREKAKFWRGKVADNKNIKNIFKIVS